MYHTTRDGEQILLEDLDTKHLYNILRMIERQADGGLLVRYRRGDETWTDTVTGEKAFELLNYAAYQEELNRRLPVKVEYEYKSIFI